MTRHANAKPSGGDSHPRRLLFAVVVAVLAAVLWSTVPAAQGWLLGAAVIAAVAVVLWPARSRRGSGA